MGTSQRPQVVDSGVCQPPTSVLCNSVPSGSPGLACMDSSMTHLSPVGPLGLAGGKPGLEMKEREGREAGTFLVLLSGSELSSGQGLLPPLGLGGVPTPTELDTRGLNVSRSSAAPLIPPNASRVCLQELVLLPRAGAMRGHSTDTSQQNRQQSQSNPSPPQVRAGFSRADTRWQQKQSYHVEQEERHTGISREVATGLDVPGHLYHGGSWAGEAFHKLR